MNKILVCKELSFIENDIEEFHYYKVHEEWVQSVKEGDFIYKIRKEIDTQSVIIGQIIKVEDFEDFDHVQEIEILGEEERIYPVSEEYFMTPISELMDSHSIESIKELTKFCNVLITSLKNEMVFIRMSHINDTRKEYLLRLFCDESPKEFYERSDNYKHRWFKVFGNFDLDFVHIINLFKLKEFINQLIDSNITLTITEKTILKKEIYNRLDIITSSINRKGIARYISNKLIGVDISNDGKNIIFGKFTNLEFYLNLLSFWNIIKSLLTVSYIPILVVLLDSDKKIIIYSLLGIIYFITLILSDEKQVDNIVDFMEKLKINKDRISNYYAIFYFGIIALLVFIILSGEVVFVPNIVSSFSNFITFLIGDLVLGVAALFLIIILVEFYFYMICSISSTIFYLKSAKKISCILLVFCKVFFWTVGIYCVYEILGVDKYLGYKGNFGWEVFAFAIALMISILKICEQIFKLKEKIKAKINSKVHPM